MFDLEEALAEISRFNSYVIDITREVNVYEQMFCNADSVKVINGNLTEVFLIIQRSMFISILTRVSAVFDAKAFKNTPNLSLDHIEHKYREYQNPELQDEFAKIKAKLAELNIKELRNKLIAHNDLSSALSPGGISHNIRDGDFLRLLASARQFCIGLCHILPGGINTVLQITPWQLKAGNDAIELVRRISENKAR